MKLTFWGTRGSIATPGEETAGYGGDTACVSISGPEPDHLIVLDAGTGIRRLGQSLDERVTRIDILLSHLHLDHIVGLGFFAPLFRPGKHVVIWGPAAGTSLVDRLGRYLSPPLFPVRLRDVAADLELRDAPEAPTLIGGFTMSAAAVIHRDPAVGFRIERDGRAVVYLPDHEPALGPSFPATPAWTSGAELAAGADLLIHDAQYTDEEYVERMGWGHSTPGHAVALAGLAGARRLALFHHDPAHDDAAIDGLLAEARRASRGVEVLAAREGTSVAI